MALPAYAADLGRPVYKAPVAAPLPFTWTGCYVGANAGWIGTHDKFLLTPTGNYLNPAGALAPPNAAGTGLLVGDAINVTDAFTGNDSGFTGGGQVGCNYQAGWFVFGAEADINGTSQDTTFTRAFAPFPSVSPGFTIGSQTESVNQKLDFYSTVRGRAGVAFDRFYVYGTAGVVIADEKSATNVSFLPAGALPVFDTSVHVGSRSTTRTAPVFGGGLEYAFTNNWTMKAEYLHFDLQSLVYNSPLISPAGVAPGYSWGTRVKESNDVVRLGVNYKFDWGTPLR